MSTSSKGTTSKGSSSSSGTKSTTTKAADAKATAASTPAAAPTEAPVTSGQGVVADNRSVAAQNVAPTNGADSGAGTGTTPPADEQTRSAARTVTTADSATPIEAPDAVHQTTPARGYDESSTNAVASHAAVSNLTGENHVALVDEDGKKLDPAKLFDGPNGPQTFVTVKTRVFEQFTYPGSNQPAARLLYPAGARVDVLTASRLQEAYKLVNADGDKGQNVRVDV